MRRLLVMSLALLATAIAFAALPSAGEAKSPLTATTAKLTLTQVHADWFGSSHRIFIQTTWKPKSYETSITVKITLNGNRLKTLRTTRWVIGHKLFKLTVPATTKPGSKARIVVQVHSKAGADRQAITLGLP